MGAGLRYGCELFHGEDLVLDIACRSGDRHGLALLLAHEFFAEWRLARDLPIGRVDFVGTDDLELHLLAVKLHGKLRSDLDLRGLLVRGSDDRFLQERLELRDAGLVLVLVTLGLGILSVLGEIALFLRLFDRVCDLLADARFAVLEFGLELLQSFFGENSRHSSFTDNNICISDARCHPCYYTRYPLSTLDFEA